MWIAAVYLDEDEAPAEPGGAMVVLAVWPEDLDRAFTAGCPAPAAGGAVRRLRRLKGAVRMPRCDACGAQVELPPLDTLAEVA